MCDETESKSKWIIKLNIVPWLFVGKKLFCGIYCLMISIFDAEGKFNDGTNERYHLLNHHKELKQLKNIGT